MRARSSYKIGIPGFAAAFAQCQKTSAVLLAGIRVRNGRFTARRNLLSVEENLTV